MLGTSCILYTILHTILYTGYGILAYTILYTNLPSCCCILTCMLTCIYYNLPSCILYYPVYWNVLYYTKMLGNAENLCISKNFLWAQPL